MARVLLIAALLAPFVAWDAAVYLMRARGDRSPLRLEEVLRHFTEKDIDTGRELVQRRNVLFPVYRVLFYALYCALLFAGLGARLEASLLPWAGGRWWLALPLFVLAVLVIRTLIFSPVAAYSEFVIQRQAGLSTITVGTWLLDLVKSLLLNTLILSLVGLPVLWLVRTLPTLWPLPAAAVILAISAFGIWISPWLIDPLFNKFTPLADSALAGQIQSLAAHAGVPVKNVYVMDASRRSTYLNAYFTGLGNSRRVVLYDTLVKECSGREVLSVVAHELGHWKANHILKGFLLETVGVVLGLWLFWWLLGSGAARAFFGLPERTSLVLLVLLPFLLNLSGTLTAPLVSAVSRRFERQADLISLVLTGDSEAFITVEQQLVRHAKADLLSPRLLQEVYGSHPLPEERIRMAESYAAGGAGAPAPSR
ncbi:M48 family metallopeptidase [bacterium]|nr:M48 family metallopeptidase [bacterium]